MAVLSALKTTFLMSNKKFEVYCLSLCGKIYRVKLGHLDEFVSLHRNELINEDLVIYGIDFDFSSSYTHPYEWYRIV